MSILSTTHTGYRYIHWQEELELFANRCLELSKCKKANFCEVRYMIPAYIKTIGDWGLEEHWFTFNTRWTTKEFKEWFCIEIERELQGKGFEKEDIQLPSTQVIEDITY